MKLRHRAKSRSSLVDGILFLGVRMVGEEKHTQLVGGFCSLIGQVWLHDGPVKGPYEPIVKAQLTDLSILFGEVGTAEGCAELDGLSFAASERSTGREGEGNQRGMSSRRRQNGEESGKKRRS